MELRGARGRPGTGWWPPSTGTMPPWPTRLSTAGTAPRGMAGKGPGAGRPPGEGFVNDPLRGGLYPGTGDPVPPCIGPGVRIIGVPERSGRKEVPPDISERAFDPAFRPGPIRLAGPGRGAVTVQRRDGRTAVGDDAGILLHDHRGLHAVMGNFPRRAAHRARCRDMTAHNRSRVPAGHGPTPEPA